MSNSIDTKDSSKLNEIAKFVSKLSEILDKSNLTQLEYENENCRINLTRQVTAVNSAYLPSPAIIPSAPAMIEASPEAVVKCETVIEEDYTNNPNAVKSPMVGVVYLSSDPNSPNYVNVGDTVAAGDTLCLIEAMKTFNPVKAAKGGRVTKILVETGDPVEYGAPLLVIE